MENSLKIRLALSLVFILSGLLLSTSLPYQDAFAQRDLLRLHVIAHSNLPQDQDLKLAVRDAILEETRLIFGQTDSKAEAELWARENSLRLQQIAETVVDERGFDYPVQVVVGNFSFPEKNYGTLALPAGLYDAVRVEIGEAKGDNWWCVLFPPLCLADLKGDAAGLVEVKGAGRERHFALRFRLWEQVAQTRYAQSLKRWWQASAAGLILTD